MSPILLNLSLLRRPVSAQFQRRFIITIDGWTIDSDAQRAVEGRP